MGYLLLLKVFQKGGRLLSTHGVAVSVSYDKLVTRRLEDAERVVAVEPGATLLKSHTVRVDKPDDTYYIWDIVLVEKLD